MSSGNKPDLLHEFSQAVSYQQYKETFRTLVEAGIPPESSEQEKALFDYTKLNWSRSERWDNTFVPEQSTTAIFAGLNKVLYWLVITESWCGDSAQCLPIIHKLAESTPNIHFGIVYRDSNLALMDAYLTNGSRSIPKLVIFDSEGTELATWGARPAAAQEIIVQSKAQQLPQAAMYQHLHTWYAKDKGRSTEAELRDIVQRLS